MFLLPLMTTPIAILYVAVHVRRDHLLALLFSVFIPRMHHYLLNVQYAGYHRGDNLTREREGKFPGSNNNMGSENW